MKASKALKYDGEFVAAIYFQLPARHKQEWLKFEKNNFKDKWSALMAFLEESYDKAVQEKLLLASINTTEIKKASGLAATVVEDDSSQSDEESQSKEDQRRQRLEDARLKAGKCPLCQLEHTFKTRWTNQMWPSDRFITCKRFNDMSQRQKAEAIESVSGCPRCTSWAHGKNECTSPVIDCKEVINGAQCHKDHSRVVCNSGVAYCLTAKSDSPKVDVFQPTLHYLQDIPINNDTECSRILWDDGSNRVLIDNGFAKEKNLRSRTTTVNMKVVGDTKQVKTNIYEFDLVDMHGVRHSVWGYGIDKIIDPDETIDLNPVRPLFPHIPDEAFHPLPKRRIDILMGLNFNCLFPTGGSGIDAVGNLKVLRSSFGSGWVVGGCHEKLKPNSVKLSTQAATARVAKVSVVPNFDVADLTCSFERITPTVTKVKVDANLAPGFWESDGMGVLPPRKCAKCRQCALKGDCSEGHLIHTLKEQAELQLIRENIKIVGGEVHVTYPFIKDPRCLANNRPVAVKIAVRLWKCLEKENLLSTYNEEIDKYLKRGTFIKLSKEELDTYEGPHQYIVHHAVLKESKSTPCRVVTNSSFNNGGHSLNSCLPKGPNSLNDMLAITLRFRCHPLVFMFDLSKAYNTMRTGIVERHLRRFIWRPSETDEWMDYAIDRVHFGDQSAACQLEVSKQMVADLGSCISEDAATVIKDDTYVDDGASGGTISEVRSLVGTKDENGNFNGTISKILSLGGFVVKDFVVEGDQTLTDDNLLGNGLFGYIWEAKSGLIHVKLSINMSKKVRSVRSKPNLTVTDIPNLATMKMSKRLLLGVANSFGDFLGIAAPYCIKLKLLMKKLYEQDLPLSWDDEIPQELRSAWIEVISEALAQSVLTFPRSTRPINAIGGPRVVSFGDGAFAAFAAAIYLVWEITCDCGLSSCFGHFSSSLLCAKSRVTPLKGYTIPRSEMSGGVLASRLLLTTVKALSKLKQPPVSAIILLDSECIISTLEVSAKKLKPFFHNRRGEMLENIEIANDICPVEPVHHVSGSLNPADVATRGEAKLSDIGVDSFWQVGPSFLRTPRDTWPVTRDFVRVKLPDDELRHPCQLVAASFRAEVLSQKFGSTNMPLTHRVIMDLLYYNNSLESRKRVLSLVMRGWKFSKCDDQLRLPITAQELVDAEKLIFASAMFDTAEALNKGELASLLPQRKGCLIITRGRLGESGLFRVLGVEYLPILMPSSRAAELVMWRAHSGYSGVLHRSVAQTLALSRNCAWIVKGKNLAKKVVFACMICKIERKKLSSQRMSIFKYESLQVCRPWTNVSLDFAGPIIIKGEVNIRSRGKSWILVVVCRNTKAVCLLATSGYSTCDFLCKWEEFVARNGKPKCVVSDRGSQLVRAGMILAEKEKPQNWKWEEVVRKNATTNWQFVPIGSQHQNGLSESLVKVLKKSLHHALKPGTVLKYSELVTLLAKIAHAINSRPIAIGSVSQDSQQEDFLSPITPNQLLLGTSNDDAPPIDYDDTDSLTARLAFVSNVYKTWWRCWYQQVLPTLVPCKKWKTEKRNLEVGDIVFMYYPSNILDDYRLAKVIEVFPDKDELVRTVRVCYRKKDKREDTHSYKPKQLTEEIVSVQRLSVLLPVSEQRSSC